MGALQTYRALIPGHAGIPDVTVSAWLTLAATRHSSAAFGSVFVEACIFWAASALDPLVLSGQLPMANGELCGPPPEGSGSVAIAQEESVFWQRYLDLRNSRAATAPTMVGPGSDPTWFGAGWVR